LVNVKLHAHRAGLPGNEISFFIVPLDPAYKAGLAGHLPVGMSMDKEKASGPVSALIRGESLDQRF
jgi:hypothetical protein